MYANRYEHIRQLGHGATGEVMLVRDRHTGQLCALKILRRREHHADGLRSISEEYHLLTALQHPHIARVYDLGIDAGTGDVYMSSEFIEGAPLQLYRPSGNSDDIADLFVQCLRALSYIHSFGLLHLDIKPQNIVVRHTDHGPEAVLIDFGYSCMQGSQPRNLIVGTAAYTAPEVILCQPFGPEADLYSLACTFFKILTGQIPFVATNTIEAHAGHLNDPIPHVSTLKKNLPEFWDQILAKMMAKLPVDRYSSASQVIEAINWIADKHYPIETVPTKLSYVTGGGIIMGRGEELSKVMIGLEKRVVLNDLNAPVLWMIEGEPGIGKSRFLAECKALLQKKFVTVMSWNEFKTTPMSDSPEACVVVGDDFVDEPEFLEAFLFDLKNDPVAFLISVSNPILLTVTHKCVTLQPLQMDQTRVFFEVVLGTKNLPTAFVARLFAHTSGIPGLLVETARTLIERGMLVTEFGQWSAKMVEDFWMDVNRAMQTDQVTARWQRRFCQSHLSAAEHELLLMLALLGRPTFEELYELSNGQVIEARLKKLCGDGLIVLDELNHEYGLAHPALKQIVMAATPVPALQEFCDGVKNHLEQQGASEEQILWFRGHGSGANALADLCALADAQRQRGRLSEAAVTLRDAMSRLNPDLAHSFKILLRLAEVEYEMNHPHEALSLLGDVLTRAELVEQRVRAHELMAVLQYQLDDAAAAESSLQAALTLLSDRAAGSALSVQINNKLARLYYDLGRWDDAVQLFQMTHAQFLKLTDEQKRLCARSDWDLLLVARKQYAEAEAILLTYFSVIKAQPHTEDYLITLCKLARLARAQGDVVKTRQWLTECLALMHERGLSRWIYVVYHEWGALEKSQKNFTAALEHFKHAFDLARALGLKRELALAAYDMAATSCERGEWIEAEHAFAYAVSVIERLLSQRSQNRGGRAAHKQDITTLFLCEVGLAAVAKARGDQAKVDTFVQKARDLLGQHEELRGYAQHLGG